MAAPGTRHASPMLRGVRFGRASTTPLAKIRRARGAWVAFASIPPSMGRPVPMNAISPSLISRAAQIAMSSVGLYARPSVAIVHLPAQGPLRLQLLQPGGTELLEVRRVIREVVHPLLEEPLEPFEGPGLRGIHL